MSKLIVEMEMPKACRWNEDGKTKRCPIAEWGGACSITKLFEPFDDNRPSWCPIVGVLPDEHGDLVDRDELIKSVNGVSTHWLNDWSTLGVLSMIGKQPTVIAAERKDDENN